MLLWMVVGLLVFTFLMQRPLKKQAEAQRKVRESITDGSRVLLTSQFFGTVTHVGDEQLIVEIAPGVEVTAMKQAVIRVVEPQEEEFEFADELPWTSSGTEPTGSEYAADAAAEPVEAADGTPDTRQI